MFVRLHSLPLALRFHVKIKFQSYFNRWVVKMKRTSNIIVLTLLNLCLLIDALPPLQNVKIVSDANRLVNDESDNSSGKRAINGGGLKGRKNDVPSKCGYEVERLQPIYQFNRHTFAIVRFIINLISDDFHSCTYSRVRK